MTDSDLYASGSRSRVLPKLGGLQLFYKLLVPFLALILIVGTFGAFLIVRDLSSRARSTLAQDLLQASLKARAIINDRELYLLESANLAANLEGMTKAVSKGRAKQATGLLRSVLALKDTLNLVAVTAKDGSGLVEFSRSDLGAEPTQTQGRAWALEPFVATALADPSGSKSAGFLTVGTQRLLAIAAPICSKVEGCTAAGAAIVGIDLDQLATQALGDGTDLKGGEPGLVIYDNDGAVLAAAGQTTGTETLVRLSSPDLVRRTEEAGGVEVHTLYAPFEVQGTSVGMVAATLPTAPVFDAVRDAGTRLAIILLVALVGIVGIGALLSRFILRQLRALVETNRALGAGDLAARAAVTSKDEIGELAVGLNDMAQKLQASHETLEMRVDERTQEVERLLSERTEFFASLSHELRTPLAVIISQSQMMLDAKNNRGRWWTEPGETIKESAQQLLTVVNEILDLARLEAGGYRVDLTAVSLGDAVEDFRRTAEGLASQSELDLTLDVPEDLPLIGADRARLREVLMNLVDNAVKYTPAGGQLELAAAANNGHVTLIVSDTGVGIPAEDLEHIFEPFYRARGVEPQRGQPSSGLGLALTRRLVEAQGGEISVASTAGKGTAFTVRFAALSSAPPGRSRRDGSLESKN